MPINTQTIAQQRIQELHEMSETTYRILLERVRHSIYNVQCAEDATHYAIERAISGAYDGRAPLINFVLVVACNYAKREWNKHGKRNLLFSEIQDRDPELQSVGATEDRPPDYEEISFATGLKDILLELEHDPLNEAEERAKARRTRRVFDELVVAAIVGYGPGVDEYEEQSEQVIPSGSQRRQRRTNLIKHLSVVLTAKEGRPVGVKSVEAATTLLRKVARPIVFDRDKP